MQPSIHYYVLSLGEKSNKLFEGFRDTLIEIENGGFPLVMSTNLSYPVKSEQREKLWRDFYKRLDQFFAIFYEQDPLGLVLVAEKMNQTIFGSVSAHNKEIFGELEGNYDATSAHDLGKIVWPIVREALSGNRERALSELDEAIRAQNVASGLDQVWHMANSAKGSTLLVEEDFRMKGSIVKTDQSWIISDQVDIRELFDDVVDRVIEKVLETGGVVIFMDSGSLSAHQKIALIFHD